jgi:hypothetical protein
MQERTKTKKENIWKAAVFVRFLNLERDEKKADNSTE